MKYKVLITSDESEINEVLESGWNVKSVTPQIVSQGGDVYSSAKGKFCFVLTKP